MEKMPHSVDGHVWHQAPGRTLLPQASGELFQPLVGRRSFTSTEADGVPTSLDQAIGGVWEEAVYW
jgi:hypothetical protein